MKVVECPELVALRLPQGDRESDRTVEGLMYFDHNRSWSSTTRFTSNTEDWKQVIPRELRAVILTQSQIQVNVRREKVERIKQKVESRKG